MATNKEDRSFKTLINKRTTSEDKRAFEEFGDNTINVHHSEIWVDSVPYNNPSQGVTLGNVEQRTLFALTQDTSVPNSQGWYAFSGSRLKDWISDKYGALYAAKLYDGSDNEIFPTDASDWFFDYQTGILTFSGSTAGHTKPYKITGYRYVGAKGISGGGGSVVPYRTSTDIVMEVDYNDVGAIDPTPGTIFTSQDEVDDYLALQGATKFKQLQAVIDTLPDEIAHTVVFELAAGVHRPPTGLGAFDTAWVLNRTITGTGNVQFEGAPSSQYTEIVASQAVIAVSGDAYDPYVDVAPATYPNDGSLIGLMAVFSTGQVAMIHDHTDGRLYVCASLSPDPSGGTVVVAQPSTVLRNSFDDVVDAQYGIFWFSGEGSVNNWETGFWDITFEPFDAEGPALQSDDQFVRYTRCVLDQLTKPSGGGGFRSRGGMMRLETTSRRAPVPAELTPDDITINDCIGASFFNDCVIMGGDWGVSFSGGVLYLLATVFIGVGKASRPSASLNVSKGRYESQILAYANPGKKVEIRGAPWAGLRFLDGSSYGRAAYQGMAFRDCVGPCIKIEAGCTFDIHESNSAIRAFTDGGGNLDVGIEFVGVGGRAHLNQYVTVTGALGDVRLVSGKIVSYADILAAGTVVDGGNNVVLKDS